MIKKLSFLFFVSIATFQFTMANSYPVRSLQEFKSVVNKLAPGDEVIIENGNYSEWSVQISNSGTKEKPIRIKSATAGKVVFTGSVNETIFKVTGSYVIFSGLSFKDCIVQKGATLIEFSNANSDRLLNCQFTKNTVKSQFTPLVVVSGNGRENTIKDCSFISNVDNQDVQVKITKESCPQFTLIEGNNFRDKGKVSWANGNGGECVQIGQDPVLLGAKVANTTVRNNVFSKCDGENEVISNKSSSNLYENNTFLSCDGELVMRGGHDCIIKGNTFKGGTGGIRINGTGHQVVNNKISDIKTAIRLMYGMAKGKDNIGFYIAASNCTINRNQIVNATIGILVGDSKNADWTGKFDTKRYPSPVMQSIAPFDNKIEGNQIKNTVTAIKTD